MTVTLDVTDDGIDLRIDGWFDTLMCVSSGMHVAMQDIVEARLVEWDEVRAGMGLRVGGAYWPGRIATGWYAVPGRQGARQFWAVFRDRTNLIEITTRVDRPTRLVLANPDRERLAWWINERVPSNR